MNKMVRLKILPPTSVDFPLDLHALRWCENLSLIKYEKKVEITASPTSYIIIGRKWSDGDIVELHLKMDVAIRKWEKNKNAVSANYGPLTFALKIDEKWQHYGQNENWAEWEVFPDVFLNGK